MTADDRAPKIFFSSTCEAAADALLSACALDVYPERDVHVVWDRAQEALKTVVERTLREGAKPE
jgi:hypothetical protein